MRKRRTLRLAAFLCAVALVLTVAACTARGSSAYQGKVDGISFELPDLGETVDIHTELQDRCIKDMQENHVVYVMNYAFGTEELSRPLPIHFSWEAQSTDAIDGYTLSISENEDMHNAITVETTENQADVYNLKIATMYYWTVTAKTGDKTATSGTACFTTTDVGPRNLYVDGITNARDVGGYACADGKRMRQGLLFRCGRLNVSGAEEPTIEITEEGIKTFTEDLGVKTELDVRVSDNRETGSITQSPLGSDVQYINIPMTYGNIMEDNWEQIREIFAILGNRDNYPLVFHCNIGTDRTGYIAFLVEALCGVSEDDFYMDYLWSSFGKIGSPRDQDTITYKYLAYINEANGDTLSEKTYNFLAEHGVSKSDMDSVIAILTYEE